MRLFVSAGEPSGDLHGANLIHFLRRRQPDLEVHGFGGDRMIEAGAHLLHPLADSAYVGLIRVLGSVPEHARLLKQAEQSFRTHRPDALVVIDYPGFHWWLAKRAKSLGIPVIYFVPPQLWAWGQWRLRKMRKLVDLALCPLTFEEPFFTQHRIPARYIGHPYFDELRPATASTLNSWRASALLMTRNPSSRCCRDRAIKNSQPIWTPCCARRRPSTRNGRTSAFSSPASRRNISRKSKRKCAA